MDLLLLAERISHVLSLHESHFREFKSAWEGPPGNQNPRDARSIAKDIGETLVGFANADGGELLVGVEDDGQVTGIPHRDETVRQLVQAPVNNVLKETPLESYACHRVEIEGKVVLYFSVEKGSRYVYQTSDGRCLQRRDKQTVPVPLHQLQFERQEQISREYDRQFVDGADVSALDMDLLKEVSDRVARGMSSEKCLQYLGLAEYALGTLRIKRAGLLLFAREISRWHPRCDVRVVRVKGTELKTGRDYNVLSDEIASGNILQLVQRAWEKLRPHLVETKFTAGGLFKERVMYPEDACLEALINAIAHRDYSIEGRNIEIFIFDDRMEVVSPGGLLSTVRLDLLKKLEGLHQSRNALVARVLREMGYMREMGEGMRRIYRLMKDHDLVPPDLRSQPDRFMIVLSHKSVFTDTDQRWLDGYEPFKLTRQERFVALLGKDGNLISPQQILDTLGLVDIDDYRILVDQMMTKGILYNALKPHGKRGAGVSKRDIGRFRIRQPDECEKGLSELYAAFRTAKSAEKVTPQYLRIVLTFLPEGNPHLTDVTRLGRLLRLLDLMNEDREPMPRLQSVWKEEATQKPVTVIPSTKTNVPGGIDDDTYRKVHVGNLAWDATEEDLLSLFGEVGKVDRVFIPVFPVTKRPKGFAFVTMSTAEERDVALRTLQGRLLKGRNVQLGAANPRTAWPVHVAPVKR